VVEIARLDDDCDDPKQLWWRWRVGKMKVVVVVVVKAQRGGETGVVPALPLRQP